MDVKNLIDTYEKLVYLELIEKEYFEQLNKVSSFISTERLKGELEYPEHLSSDFILPLKIKGRFLREGRPKKRYYSEKEIIEGINRSQELLPLPLHTDHKDKEVATIKGAITKIWWDSIKRVAMYEGHINEEVSARNVIDGVIDSVSATIYSRKVFTPEYGITGVNLRFTEISLVTEGAEQANTLEIKR